MRWLRRAWKRLSGAFAGPAPDSDLAAEIESHIRMQTDDNIRCGMAPAEARRQAVLKFGGVESAKESYRDQRGLPLLETFARDLRYAARVLAREPGFVAVAGLSLVIGIAATSAIFSVVNALLLEPPPYREPARLATVSLEGSISAPYYLRFQREARSLEQAALFVNWSFNLARTGSAEPERVAAARVSAGLFSLLGVSPRLGRAFTEAEDQPGRDSVVLISDRLWRSHFAADPAIVGRTVSLSGQPYTIIGVMPPGFQFPEGPELPFFVGSFPPAEMWRPMALAGWERTDVGSMNFAMIARLRPGVTPAQARMELNDLAIRIWLENNHHGGNVVTLDSLADTITAQARTPLLVLFGAVGLALLIACVNVANLLLARGLRRRPEIALRLALGASRGRIFAQLLTESLLLAFCAGLLAIPLTRAGIAFLTAIAPAGLPGLDKVVLDGRILAFSIALSLATTLIFGVLPALRISRGAPGDALKTESRSSTAGPSRLRRLLVVAEFALSLVLLVGAGLLVRSFATVSATRLGFHEENVLTARLYLPEPDYDDRRRSLIIDRLTANCAALSGVREAAAVSTLPLTDESEGWGVTSEAISGDYVMARVRAVSPAYFRAMGIALQAGREFMATDMGKSPVVILSRTAARQLFPGVADPVGRRLGDPAKRPESRMLVVGIVDDTHASGLDTEIRPYLYVPFRQFSPPEFALVLRATADPAALASAVKEQVWRVDKDLPVTHLATMRSLVTGSVASRRFQALLMGLFAAFALSLAALGIYGVVSYSVAQRTHEFGIRIALGAARADVLAGVLRESGALALAGAALGILASFGLTPLLASMLYGVSATDPAAFAASVALLMAVAAAACLLPARRAASLDPMVSLRYE